MWRAFWDTTKLATLEPKRFFRTPSTEENVIWPIVYGIVAFTIPQVVFNLLISVALLAMGGVASALTHDSGSSGGLQNDPGMLLMGEGLCMLIGSIPLTLLQAPLQSLIGILIAAGAAQGLLKLLGKTKRPFDDTLRAVAYSNAAYVWMLVPCVGWFLGYPWMLTCETIAVRETHETTTGTAMLATLGYRFAFIFVVVVLYFAVLAAVLGGAGFGLGDFK